MAQLIGLGRIGKDAELRYTANNDAVANVSLAFNYGRKGEDGKKPTQWVEASIWNKRAEALAQYLLKGTQVFVVVDDIHIDTYETRDGGTGSKMVGTISNIEFASSPQQGDGQQAPRQQQGGQRQQSAPQQRQAAPQQRQQQAPRQAPQQRQAPQSNGSGFDDMDDDIPF